MPHTPGPWQLSENGLGVYGPGDDPWGITHLMLYEQRAIAQGQGISDEEQKANARLIAAAPDLLAALKGLHSLVKAWQNGPMMSGIVWHEQPPAVVAAEAAVAKAENGAP